MQSRELCTVQHSSRDSYSLLIRSALLRRSFPCRSNGSTLEHRLRGPARRPRAVRADRALPVRRYPSRPSTNNKREDV